MTAFGGLLISPAVAYRWQLRATLALLTLALVALLYDQPLALSLLAIGLVVLVAMSVDRRVVVPIIVLALPLEISKELFPFLQTSASTTSPTLQVSIIDFGRLAVFAAAAFWAVSARGDWLGTLPRSGLYLPLGLLAGTFILSLSYTMDPSGGGREVIRLATNLALFALVILFVQDRSSLRWALLALAASGLAAALAGLYQQVTDTYFWNDLLATSSVPRRNATFADPNVYARFLNISMVMALALLSTAKGRERYLMAATLIAVACALPFTGSRSGWLTAAIMLPLLTVSLPLSPRTRLRLLVAEGLAVTASLVLALALDSSLIDRIETLRDGPRSLGARYYLIQAAWQMFLDNPLYGLGLDSFRTAMEGPYNSFVWQGHRDLLSHTSLMTLLAELGAIGMAVLAFLLYRWAKTCWNVYRAADKADRADKALIAGLAASLLVIFLSSQAEGRLFEDAYLWLFLGLTVAIAGIRHREQMADRAAAEAE